MKSNHAATTIGTEARNAQTGLLTRLAGAVARRLGAWRSRQALSELLLFDDRQLADIGVTRGDIEWALAQPLSHDTASALERLRHGQSL